MHIIRTPNQQAPLAVNDAISRSQELVVARRAALGVDRDLPVGGQGRREPYVKVGHLTHDDLVQVHPAREKQKQKQPQNQTRNKNKNIRSKKKKKMKKNDL